MKEAPINPQTRFRMFANRNLEAADICKALLKIDLTIFFFQFSNETV